VTLVEFLGLSGWTKSEVARRVGVSPAAVGKWDEIPKQHLETLKTVLRDKEPAPLPERMSHPSDLSDDELKAIIRTRSKFGDWQICQEHGWRVWEFQKAILEWVKRNPYRPNDEA